MLDGSSDVQRGDVPQVRLNLPLASELHPDLAEEATSRQEADGSRMGKQISRRCKNAF